jgi:hypothetical protein
MELHVIIDEYKHMSETTCLDSVYKFCKDVLAVFDDAYPSFENMKYEIEGI